MDYDPETGVFTWKWHPEMSPQWNGKWADKPAGRTDHRGYQYITLNYRTFLGHRAAWLHVHGAWPAHDIDHRNNDPSNNRITNLRLANTSQNIANSRLSRTNTSGFKGVSWNKMLGRYTAYITLNYKRIHLGCFDTPEEAHAAYCKAALELHGEFANFGRAA